MAGACEADNPESVRKIDSFLGVYNLIDKPDEIALSDSGVYDIPERDVVLRRLVK